MDPFADVQDVAAIWRSLSDDESNLVAAWIDEASQQIRDEVPDVDGLDVDERITAGTLAATTVRSVVARMVRRVLMNPEGARQRSQGVDDYQESVTLDASLSSGEMFISEREMARLMGSPASSRSAFSVDTVPAVVSYPWWAYSFDVIP